MFESSYFSYKFWNSQLRTFYLFENKIEFNGGQSNLQTLDKKNEEKNKWSFS